MLLLMFSATFVSVIPGQAATASPALEGVNIIVKGYYTATASLSYAATTNVSATYVLDIDSFTAENKAPSDLKASVARTFSNTYGGYFSTSTSTVRGMWQTVKITPENEYTQYSLSRDEIAVQTFYTTEDLYTQLDRTMQSYGKTAADATIEQIYAELTLDRSVIDSFFQATQTEQIQTVAENYATDQQKIATVLDPIFDQYIYDLCFAPVNLTDYATGWTIADEVDNVMTNTTDTALDGATKLGSIRNALYGYLGSVLLDDEVIGAQGDFTKPPAEDNGRFIGFEVTDTTYIVKFNLLNDLVSSSKLIQNFGFALTQIFPSTMIGEQQAFPFWVHLLVSFVIGAIVAGIDAVIATTKGKKKKKERAWKVFAIAFGVTMLIMAISFPMLLSFTA